MDILDQLAAAPNLRCVVIHRDCRDVVSSTLHKVRPKWHARSFSRVMDTAPKVAHRWVRCIQTMERNGDRVHIIRYEDLVRRPHDVLPGLGAWLGGDPAGLAADLPRETSIGKYRTGLTDEELAQVLDIAGPTMARIGYQ